MARGTRTDKVERAGGTSLARVDKKAQLARLRGTLASAFLKFGGKQGAMEIATLAYGEDAELTAMVNLWFELTAKDQAEIQLEELCHLVSIHPADFIGKIASWAWRMGRPITELMGGINTPKLAELAWEHAMDKEKFDKTFKDREKFLIQGGVWPDKTPLVQVSQQNINQAGPVAGLPRFEEDAAEEDYIDADTTDTESE